MPSKTTRIPGTSRGKDDLPAFAFGAFWGLQLYCRHHAHPHGSLRTPGRFGPHGTHPLLLPGSPPHQPPSHGKLMEKNAFRRSLDIGGPGFKLIGKAQ